LKKPFFVLITIIIRLKKVLSNGDNIEENLRRRNKHYSIPVVSNAIVSSSLLSKGIQLDKPLQKKSVVATKASPRANKSPSNVRKTTPAEKKEKFVQ
jgi:hypothetical protein